MSLRWLLIIGAVLWVGVTLLLSEVRWLARRPLDERLRPYVPGGWAKSPKVGVLSVESFRDVVVPLASSIGDELSRLFGLQDDLATRLRRIHSDLEPAAIRVRQLTWSTVSLVGAAAVAVVTGMPVYFGLLFVLGAPLLTFLVIEQQIASQSDRWKHRVFLELPVVCEQIGMLLSAGYSLGGSIERIARRGNGCCARDLGRVGRRIRQGLSETDALREWAVLSGVPAVHRLVGVLALNRDTGDLGRLISEEARSVRREVQRQLAATIDKRAQQVWIPVTVATLLPGTIFLAVPFLQAIDVFRS